jgi:hypothetical protein
MTKVPHANGRDPTCAGCIRKGANYAWPRGVKWLMENRILSTQ